MKVHLGAVPSEPGPYIGESDAIKACSTETWHKHWGVQSLTPDAETGLNIQVSDWPSFKI